MVILQNVSYIHSNRDLLFDNINLVLNTREKVALIGNNGIGKSILLKIIAKELPISDGQLKTAAKPYYIPQVFGQYNHLTIAQAIGIDGKLSALREILNGIATEENYTLLDDDWTIEERCNESLKHWQLHDLKLTQTMGTLSGGQKAKVFLAGVSVHQPEFILMDEPSNHLDISGRQLLYDFIQSTSATLLVTSHDRKLVNLLEKICELSKQGIITYGGNYDFYKEQKQIQNNALLQDVHSKERAFRKAKEKEHEALEKQQKRDAKAKRNLGKAGLPKIVANTWKNSAENSSSKMKSVHAEKRGDLSLELQELRSSLPDVDKMKFGFDNSPLHKGKVLFKADHINWTYHNQFLWKENLSFQLTSGERIVLRGTNGSGKTTLIRVILGDLEPQIGILYRAENKSVYIDQDYSLINNQLSVYEQAQSFNSSALLEHEIKIRLNRFLFTKEDWNKACCTLSGGERMRLMLCCLTIHNQSPDIIILDEPTNNLDIQNIEILTSAINAYQGTLIVVSHDEYFLEQINIERAITLFLKKGLKADN